MKAKGNIFFGTMLRMLLSLMALMPLLWSCDAVIYEGEGDCSVTYRVSFRYVRNIVEADAFPSQVHSVSLFVFDKAGRFVTSKTESGAALSEPGYAMEIDVEPGTYDVIAWCGMEEGDSFSLAGGANPASKADLVCRMARTAASTSSVELTPLFHGMAELTFPDEPGVHVAGPVDLTKDTNTIRIVLQSYNGVVLNAKDFGFTIEDANGLMDYDNSLMEDDVITYGYWSKNEAVVDVPGTKADIGSVSSVVAEISMARLVPEHNPVLTVTANNELEPGKDGIVLSLPLKDLLLIARGEAKRHLSDADYLDYQDDWTLVFFVTDQRSWYMDAGIYVNGWHVVFQSSDL